MATHSSVLAWRIPGTGEPGGLPSMGSHRVGSKGKARAELRPALGCLHFPGLSHSGSGPRVVLRGAAHSSVLAWRLLWMEEPGGLWLKASPRVRHDRSVTRTRNSSSCPPLCVGGSRGPWQQIPMDPRFRVCTVVYRFSLGPFGQGQLWAQGP